VVVLALGLLLGACSKKSETETETEPAGGTGSCGAAPTALANIPSDIQAFPGPSDLTITDVEVAGPSTIVSGSIDGGLDEVFDSYKTAFDQAGYTVTSSEKEEDDAEVNFSGNSTTGQVKLSVPCEGRTDVSITIRPA